jgi:hypothetical protein
MSRRANSLLILLTLITACSGGGGGNSQPSAIAANDSATTNEDSAVMIDVTSNDTNVTASTVEITSPPTNGTALVDNAGVITYSPNDNFNGTDSLAYRAGSSVNAGTVTAPATVTISVTDINDAPTASDDSVSTLVNTPLGIDALANDSDIDGTLAGDGLQIIANTASGNTAINTATGIITYTPDGGFIGIDSFSYIAVDDDGDASNEATVSITVVPIESTVLTVTELPLPIDNYSETFSEELDKTILQSELQTFPIPTNTVSFALHMIGDGVNTTGSELFVSELIDPNGLMLQPMFRTTEFCSDNFCSLLVPKRPDISPTAGEWQFRIASATNDANFTAAAATINLAVRTGPAPLFSEINVSRLSINTVVTGSAVTPANVQLILDKAAETLLLNGVEADFDPITTLVTEEFAEVSKNFDDPTTSELLITYGNPDKLNLFILDSFSGPGSGGLWGIAGGVPASLGVTSQYNGVLVNGTAIWGTISNSLYVRTIAAIIVHEMGHYLGLRHTTEADFSHTDLVDDTPECLEASHDINGNGFADQEECPDGSNIMFWDLMVGEDKTDFSSDQQHVLHATPIGETAGEDM